MSAHYFKKESKENMVSQKTLKNSANGMSLIEVIVASAIIVASVVSIMGAYGGLTSLSLKNTPKIQAAMLLEEGAEALKIMRDSGWTANINPLVNGTTYRFTWDNTASRWKATTSVALIDSTFDRTFVTTAVYRDLTTYDVVSSSCSNCSIDTGTRKVTISVSWLSDTGTTTKSVDTYVYNLHNS